MVVGLETCCCGCSKERKPSRLILLFFYGRPWFDSIVAEPIFLAATLVTWQ
jgi:hypothetical protein